jgi:hypothetical protein
MSPFGSIALASGARPAMADIGRRAALLAPLVLGACATDGPAPLPPLVEGYAHLTRLRLNVREVVVEAPQPGPARRLDPPAPVNPLVEMERMGRERLTAAGSAGRAVFAIEQASLTRERLSEGSILFSGEERATVVLRGRLEVEGPEGAPGGFASAEVRRAATGPLDGTEASRAATLVRRAMEDMNVELEFQIRRNLRPFLVTAPPGPGVTAEPLPRG